MRALAVALFTFVAAACPSNAAPPATPAKPAATPATPATAAATAKPADGAGTDSGKPRGGKLDALKPTVVEGKPREISPGALFVVGFAKERFAAITSNTDDGRGGVEWQFRVVDLTNDKVLTDIGWHDESAKAKATDIGAFISVKGGEIDKALATHGIAVAPVAKLGDATIKDGERTLTVAVELVPREADEDMELEHLVVMTAKKGKASAGKKVLTIIVETVRDGMQYTYAPSIAGVVQSPVERRAVVVVRQVNRGMEGPPNLVKWTFIGASLDARFDATPR